MKEKTKELELKLKKIKLVRRVIYLAIIAVAVILIISFAIARENSKELLLGGLLGDDFYRYNDSYTLGIVLSCIGLFGIVILFISELLYFNYGSITYDNIDITVTRTLLITKVYIEGELKRKYYLISFKFYHEEVLPNDEEVKIIFLHFPFRLARFVFSDNIKSIEI